MIDKLSQDQKKGIYWTLIVLGLIILLFIIIFNGAYWGINTRDKASNGDVWDLQVTISVLIPFFISMLCFTSSEYFNIMTKKEVENKYDQMLDNGWLNLEQWISGREMIDKNFSKKVDAKARQKLMRIEQETKLMEQEQKKKQEIMSSLNKVQNVKGKK